MSSADLIARGNSGEDLPLIRPFDSFAGAKMRVDVQQITGDRAFPAAVAVVGADGDDEPSVSFATPPNQLRACISGARK